MANHGCTLCQWVRKKRSISHLIDQILRLRTDPKKIIVEFGIHDRFRIENSREARTIKQIIVVRLSIVY